ncbi:Glycine cleavage system transcriptional activator [Aquimixticola soesokkakensis]|uniref:Glycine cleavage system transcriptional activator n=1 Tax=Aquimixticola soesokkakensis TaxID=1519096 RepID=A0A1Y5T700_9RHOB|nr:LysR substrate-binding domain-containing protein [Aquimixticola soesokkakensis]SLN57223.1 Glycine cleavage system transcriptional activator [Aquimixticola soesokkakensis]
MRKRVPLNAIRAFEATARMSSVVKAADELCVTPTAVSHQIRLLEDFLQIQLFIRKNSRIELTTDARANVARITQALDLINEAVLCLEKSDEDVRRRLSVSASASVVSLWLMPRLSEFMKTAPEVDLNVRTFLSRKEAESQESDIRICNWQSQLDCQIEPLIEEEIIPVCAPEIAAQYGGNARDILANAPLVHVDRIQDGLDGTYPDWARYLTEYGVSRSDLSHGARFNQAGTAMEAADAGVGVILGRSLLIEKAIARGTLVPVAESYPIRSPYFMLSPWKTDGRETMQRFKDWIVGKVRTNELVHAI